MNGATTTADVAAQRRAVFEVCLATVLFSFVGPVAKLIELTAATLTFYRALFGCISLALFVVLKRSAQRLSSTQRWQLLGMGVLMSGNWFFFIWATQVATVAVAVVCLFTYPLLTALLEPLVFKERYHWSTLISTVGVLLGVLVITGTISEQASQVQGAIFGLLAASCLTLRNVWSRHAVRSQAPSQVTLVQFAVAGVIFLPAAVSHGELPEPSDLVLLAIVGALLTTVSQALFIASLRYLSSASSSILVSVQPIYTTLIAWALLGEVPGTRTVVGGLLILGSVFVALGFRAKQRTAHPARG